MRITDINGNQRECVAAYPDRDYPGYIKVEYKNPRRSYNEWYPIGDFMDKNPGFSFKDERLPHEAPPEVSSFPSSSTKSTLTDKTQHWQTNEYAGFRLWISRGQGEGQVRNIRSNTKDTVVIDTAWETKPNKFSQYILSHNIHEEMPAQGNTNYAEIQYKYEQEAKKMKKERKKAQKLISIAIPPPKN